MAFSCAPGRDWGFATSAEVRGFKGTSICYESPYAEPLPLLEGAVIHQWHMCFVDRDDGPLNLHARRLLKNMLSFAKYGDFDFRGTVLLVATTNPPTPQSVDSIKVENMAFSLPSSSRPLARPVRPVRPVRVKMRSNGRLVGWDAAWTFVQEWFAVDNRETLRIQDTAAFYLRSSYIVKMGVPDDHTAVLTSDEGVASDLRDAGVANVHAVTPTGAKVTHLCFGCGHVRGSGGRVCVCRTVAECGRPACAGLRNHRCSGERAHASRVINTANYDFLTRPSCAQCHAEPSPNQPLKSCAQCKAVTYCGRECQLAAWPAHKESCRPA